MQSTRLDIPASRVNAIHYAAGGVKAVLSNKGKAEPSTKNAESPSATDKLSISKKDKDLFAIYQDKREDFDLKTIQQLEHVPLAALQELSETKMVTNLNDLGLKAYHVDSKSLTGQALTVKTAHGDNLIAQKALQMAKPGDVLFIDAGGHVDTAVVGGLILATAQAKHLAGIVVYGALRDVEEYKQSGLPCYALGHSPKGPTKEGPGAMQIPLELHGKVISPGDFIIGKNNILISCDRSKVKSLLDRSLLANKDRLKYEKGNQQVNMCMTRTIRLKKNDPPLVQPIDILLEELEKIPTPNISDAASWLPRTVQPLGGHGFPITNMAGLERMVGTAFIVNGSKEHIMGMMKDIKPQDVLVINGNRDHVLLDIEMADQLNDKVFSGVIINGISGVEKLEKPLFALGYRQGPFAEASPPVAPLVHIGELAFRSGDVLVGDEDGVLAPPLAEIPSLLSLAQIIKDRELAAAQDIAQGSVAKPWVDRALKERGVPENVLAGTMESSVDVPLFRRMIEGARLSMTPRGWGGLQRPQYEPLSVALTGPQQKLDQPQMLEAKGKLVKLDVRDPRVPTFSFDEVRAGRSTGNIIHIKGGEESSWPLLMQSAIEPLDLRIDLGPVDH